MNPHSCPAGQLSDLEGLRLTILNLYDCWRLKGIYVCRPLSLVRYSLTSKTNNIVGDIMSLKNMPLVDLNLGNAWDLDGNESHAISEMFQ